jgi:hypothetical protein
MFSHLDEVEMTRKYRKEHDLMGFEAEDLASAAEFLKPGDTEPFVYPHDRELAMVGVRGIYLNNYIRWDTKAQHELMIKLYGYETAAQQRTFDTYNDVDCFHYSGLHDYIKLLKWGYGKVTDHASREIRLKRMTREEGIARVKRYQELPPSDVSLLLGWLGMDERELWTDVDRFRDPRIWRRSDTNEWRLCDSVTFHAAGPRAEAVQRELKGPCEFVVTPSREPERADDCYILIGRGWVDQSIAEG